MLFTFDFNWKKSYGAYFFSFPSNAGGESIVDIALDFWKAGRSREEIELRDLETVLSLSVFNNKKSEFELNVRKDPHSYSRLIDVWLFSVSRWIVAHKFDW